MKINVYCTKDVFQDDVLLFQKDRVYEAHQNEDGTIDGRSEIEQYVTISTSGDFFFEEYFYIISN